MPLTTRGTFSHGSTNPGGGVASRRGAWSGSKYSARPQYGAPAPRYGAALGAHDSVWTEIPFLCNIAIDIHIRPLDIPQQIVLH